MIKSYLNKKSRKSKLTMKMRVIMRANIHRLRTRRINKSRKINSRSRKMMNSKANLRKIRSNNLMKVNHKSKIYKRKLNLVLKEEEEEVEDVGEEKGIVH